MCSVYSFASLCTLLIYLVTSQTVRTLFSKTLATQVRGTLLHTKKQFYKLRYSV